MARERDLRRLALATGTLGARSGVAALPARIVERHERAHVAAGEAPGLPCPTKCRLLPPAEQLACIVTGMTDHPISDNPSQKHELALAWVAEWVVRHRRIAMLLTRLLGATGRETRDLLQNPELMDKVEASVPLIRERVGLPDRFNALLGPRGWATFEDMDADVAREAVLLAEAGDLAGAEGLLVRHFDAETLREGVERLCGEIPAFAARSTLLLGAVEDHRAGRYHASVPVALAQIDGIAYELTGHSFFVSPKKATHLLVQDSIAGHPSGLAALAGVMSRGRWQTSASEIDAPYRHGIIHGRDLSYANEKVSAKSLATLLVLGSWARSVEHGEEDAEPPFELFDPDHIRLEDAVREVKGAAGALFRAWFSRSDR